MPDLTEYEQSLLDAALAYAGQGVAVFPARVERLADTGKKRSQFIGTWRQASTINPGQIEAWWGPGGAWRGAHVCIDTTKSRIVVIDADGTEGLDSINALKLTDSTPARVRTPTGGQHLYYREREDYPIGNSQRALAPGIDTRGLGGLVFAPPSRDAAGAYEWLNGQPYWDALPSVPAAVVNGLKRAVTREDPPVPAAVADGTEGAVFEAPSRSFTRDAAILFCKPAMDALRTAQDGEINSRLNDAAKTLSHFDDQFWTRAEATQWLMRALAATVYDGKTWKAADTIASAYRSASDDWRAVLEDDPFATTGAEGSAPAESSAVDALLAEMLTPAELMDRPPPMPLILDWLDLDSLAWLIGKPGSYKSFLALDWAGHIGQGVPWRGHPVHQGEAVYIVAEGTTGISMRVRAWEDRHTPMKAIRFLPRPVQASGAEWAVLVEACRRIGPVLVVLDTQARVTVGMDENDNTEMGKFIHRAEELRAATGACVLIVHHIGRNGEDARGASALDGAQSTEIKIARSTRGPLWALISQDKQKDMAESEPIEIQLERVELGREPTTGRDLSSLVLAPMDPFETASARKVRDWIDNHAPNQAELLGIIVDHFGLSGGTKTEIKRVLQERRGQDGRNPMAHGSYSDAWAALYDKEIIIRVAGSQRFVVDQDRSVEDDDSV